MRQGIVAGAEITTKTAEGFHFGFQSADLGISSNVPQLCQYLLSSFVDLRLPPPVRFARSLLPISPVDQRSADAPARIPEERCARSSVLFSLCCYSSRPLPRKLHRTPLLLRPSSSRK